MLCHNRAVTDSPTPRPAQLDSPVVAKGIKYMARAQVWLYRRTNGRIGGKWRIGAGFKKPQRLTKALLGHFSVNEVAPKRYVHEFRVKDETGLPEIGRTLSADWFQVGQYVDARSNTKGKGF